MKKIEINLAKIYFNNEYANSTEFYFRSIDLQAHIMQMDKIICDIDVRNRFEFTNLVIAFSRPIPRHDLLISRHIKYDINNILLKRLLNGKI